MIVPLQPSHCVEVAQLHLACLPTPFCGRPGRELLRRYYKGVSQNQGASGFVALKQNQVVGYVCGVWRPNELQRWILRHDGLGLLFWGGAQLIYKPALISDLWRRLVRFSKNAELNGSGYELRPIVIAPAARGSGIAIELIQALLRDAAQRGFTTVHLYAEQDNEPAIRLYRKAGFCLAGEAIRAGQACFRYERSVSLFKDSDDA